MTGLEHIVHPISLLRESDSACGPNSPLKYSK
jgi:hypothetical protein